MSRVRKAVFPAAGLGTRFLPATKAQPKEMLPLVDKPTIQYVVEEAVASGLDDIIIVIGPGKEAIRKHFSPLSRADARRPALKSIQKILARARVRFVEQRKPLGLGHAVALWDIDAAHLDALATSRENRKFLAGIALPEGVKVQPKLEVALAGAEVTLFVVPSHGVRACSDHWIPPASSSMT